MPTPIFKRILLKISGEALAAQQGFGVDTARIHEVAAELADVHSLGIQIAIVVGGGNFFRGVADLAKDMDRVSADRIQQALMGLPEAQRIAITLMDVCGFTAKQVAAITDAPRGTVLARVHRGRKLLALSLTHPALDPHTDGDVGPARRQRIIGRRAR